MFTFRHRAMATVAAAAIALTSFSFTPAKAGMRTGDAVALAAIAGVFGTVAALAARDRHNHYYRPHYAAPYPGPYVRGPVHHGPRWGGWHRHHWYR
jgi:hypothetical protein